MTMLQSGAGMLANRLPKVIGPGTHAIIDYVVAGTFFTMGALFWNRNKRAAVSSLVCGAATAISSMVTDYPGGVWKSMSYRSHGKIDAGLAGLTAMMPNLMGFNDDTEARFFQMQGIAEAAVTGMTDFDTLDRAGQYRWEQAA